MRPTLDHVLLTRFNLPSPGAESLIRARDGWLRERVGLFEDRCLPSVRAQTAPVTWIVYFDPESPTWLKEWIAGAATRGGFRPLFRAEVGREALIADLRKATGALGDVLVTTNLDNDDALSADFAARIQNSIESAERHAIFLRNGLILKDGRLYRHVDRNNAFCSVAEPWDSPVTAWADWHTRLAGQMPSTVLGGPPAWLQVVHGNNVSNRVRGVLTTPAAHASGFGELLAGLDQPSRAALLADRLIVAPLRSAKLGARRLAKNTILPILGKERFDRLKHSLAVVSARVRR